MDTDVPAALSIAVHGESLLFASGKRLGNDEELSASQRRIEASEETEIPSALREVIQGLDLPTAET